MNELKFQAYVAYNSVSYPLMKALQGTIDHATRVQNQLILAFMAAKTKLHPLAANLQQRQRPNETSAAVLWVLALGLTAIALILLPTEVQAPLGQGILSAFAVIGLFFLLASTLGRVKFNENKSTNAQESIANAWPDAVLVTTRLGATIFANAAFDRLFAGLPSAHAASHSGYLALENVCQAQPASSEALFRLMRAAERNEESHEVVYLSMGSINLRDKETSRRLRISVAPLELANTNSGRLVLWRLEDITNIHSSLIDETSILKSQLTAYDAAPLGLMTVTDEGQVEWLNPTLQNWLGHSSSASNTQVTLDTLFDRSGADSLRPHLNRHSPSTFKGRLDLRTVGGRRVPVTVQYSPNPTGTVNRPNEDHQYPSHHHLAVFRDPIAAPSTHTVETADISFARHFQSAPFGIAMITTDGRIDSANGAFTTMVREGLVSLDSPILDSSVIDVLGQDATPETRHAIAHQISEALAGRTTSGPVDFTIGRQAEFGRRLYATPLSKSGNRREAAILYVIDTTEQRALEAKFTQSQKMDAVGKLAGGIAHDFNNVLTAIIGSADLMLQTHRASDAAHKDIQNIKQCANRAAGLVGKLMAFSRQQPMQLEAVSVADILVDARPVIKTQLGEKIDYKPHTGRDLWFIKADRTQVDQVLLNLSVNAKDAMPDGGTLSIRAHNVTEREAQKLGYTGLPIAEYVVIEVEDTGTGMPPEVLAKIFEPFFTTKEVGKGTGLGLATVYGIVKQSSGYIYADSTPGKGTTFRVYFPRFHVDTEAYALAQKAARKDPKPEDLTGHATVLVVEDEDIVRSVAVRSLKRLGYNVLEATNGFEALDVVAAQNGAVDIVVSDVVMPEMDGPAFLKAVRKSNPDLKIIFVSGHTNEAFKTSLDSNETFAFLPKPFSLPQLAAKVKEELTS